MLRSYLKKVVNKDRKLGAASDYYAGWVKDDNGTDIPWIELKTYQLALFEIVSITSSTGYVTNK